MVIMRLTDVNQSQHHENETLQHDDQQTEDRPGQTGCNVAEEQCPACQAAQAGSPHERDDHEQNFFGVKVAEQPHAMREGFCQIFEQLHGEVQRPEQEMVAKRSGEQFMHPTANALDLDAVVQAQQQNGDRHAQGDRQVGRRHHTQIHMLRVVAGRGARGLPEAG